MKIYINSKHIVSFYETSWIANNTSQSGTKIIVAFATDKEGIYLIKETVEQLLTLLKWDSYGIKDELL